MQDSDKKTIDRLRNITVIHIGKLGNKTICMSFNHFRHMGLPLIMRRISYRRQPPVWNFRP